MVTAINVYLVTDGNGQEAVAFYQEVFQAKVVNLFLWKAGVNMTASIMVDSIEEAQRIYDKLITNAKAINLPSKKLSGALPMLILPTNLE